jgi:hypothetical protein
MRQRSRKRLANQIERYFRLADPAPDERRDRAHVAVIKTGFASRSPE